MANQKVERQLERLKEIRSAGPSESGLQELRKALDDKVNLIVAKASAIAAEWQSHSLLPSLLAAYNRLFEDAAKADPQCWGKNELSKCLKELGVAESAVFIRGLNHFQWESTWGGKTDSAALLRSTCALALVQCTDIPRHEILLHLVTAFTEADANVRTDAARALEQMNGRDVALLLRLKARTGDKEARVTGQVLESILAIEGASGVPFVSDFLKSPDNEISEESALALGASRLPEAVEALKAAFLDTLHGHGGTAILRAISASRQDSAFHFLLEQVKTARRPVAEDVLWALQLHRDSQDIVSRIRLAVAQREELKLLFREIYSVEA
jgi:HEAT repeat protein